MEVRKVEKREVLRKVIVKIGLKRIDIQKGIIVEVLLDSRMTSLVISLEFARKKEFKLKKIERLIYVRNMDRTFMSELKIIDFIYFYFSSYLELRIKD